MADDILNKNPEGSGQMKSAEDGSVQAQAAEDISVQAQAAEGGSIQTQAAEGGSVHVQTAEDISVQTQSPKTGDELARAYEADRERKLVREEELQAARDYLSVLLEEAEDRSEELEGKKQEAHALAARLTRTENEIEQLKNETQAVARGRDRATAWMCISIFELLLIAGLVLVLYFKLSGSQSVLTHNGAEENTTVQSGAVQTEPVTTLVEEPMTAKFTEDLEMRVRYMSAEAIAPFTATVETIDGLEYLVFTRGSLRICYKNEYYPEDMSFRKAVIVENGSNRFTFSRSYDLTSDMVELCPKLTCINGTELLVFVDYSGNAAGGMPQEIRLISCDDFRMYDCTDLSERIGSLMQVEALSERSCLEDSPMVYQLTTSKATYLFAVSEEYVTEVQYNEYTVPEYESEFVLEIGEDGLSWSTTVKLGEQRYMGRLTGRLILSDKGLSISGAKFGAFAPANQEDAELGGYIRTAAEVPEQFVTLLGSSNRRYLIAVSDAVERAEYYWDNLNTDDADNWIYYDADGNAASLRGIDVSKYKARIDWEKVAAAGVEFAIIRLGYRGMNEGTLTTDEYFLDNIRDATKYGIKVGVYFFSQAIDEEEAIEEAEYVLDAIRGYDVTFPVVIDTEKVTTYNARANGLSMAARTAVCRAFCERIAEEGYIPMIYANTTYMIMGLDLEQLNDYDKWYACYSSDITFPYNFQILQYSDSGSVDGISGKVDLNISFKDYSAGE